MQCYVFKIEREREPERERERERENILLRSIVNICNFSCTQPAIGLPLPHFQNDCCHIGQRPATYYDTNQLRANPSKTQVCAFHLRNREAKRELNIMWNGTRLSNTTTPVHLGIHLDRTLCYKTHIEKTKMKVNARNNIIRKLANSKWGCEASTLRPSCLALCYSAVEYACPVWARSAHAPKLNPALHDCCRIISGCLKPTNLDSVH